MQEIPLQQIPRQNFTITLDNHDYDITINAINEYQVAISISRDTVPLVDNLKCCPVEWLIPFPYLSQGLGNFVFTTVGEVYPYYTDFGVGTALTFFSGAEVPNA